MNKKYEELMTTNWTQQFNQKQLDEIIYGLTYNLNLDLYAKPEFTAEQMREIRIGLDLGVNAEVYANPNFSHMEMFYIQRALTKNLPVEPFLKAKNNNEKSIKEIYQKLQQV